MTYDLSTVLQSSLPSGYSGYSGLSGFSGPGGMINATNQTGGTVYYVVGVAATGSNQTASAASSNAVSFTGTGNLAFAGIATPGGTIQEKKVAIAASAIDLNAGNYFSKTISGVTTFTVSNVPSAGTAVSFVLDLTNGGSATVNWWTGVKWGSGSAPTLTAAGRDVLGFFTHDGGTTWSGFVLGKDVK
jgi:hypothetical protein